MKVRRYGLCGFENGMREREEGDWVDYDDYKELQAEYARLREAMLAFAVDGWHEEVARRPMINVYRRILDGHWRRIIEFAGGDPESLVGPCHDDLLASRSKDDEL